MLNKNISTFIFFISILIGQNTKPTVAILDFEGQGVDASEVKTLSERMRTEIGNTNAVRLIERKAVEKIMMEQGLQQSGCTTDECAAEVGQLLGVQFMISGSIGKMGKSYTIDCKMFSVETGETVRTKSATHKGDVSGLLTEMEILEELDISDIYQSDFIFSGPMLINDSFTIKTAEGKERFDVTTQDPIITIESGVIEIAIDLLYE